MPAVPALRRWQVRRLALAARRRAARDGRSGTLADASVSESADSASVYKTHQAAHGLVPDLVEQVTDGTEAALKSGSPLYFDIHRIGPGKVKASDVVGVHEKDLAVQDKYRVNLINYWVDEKLGIVMCLAEAPNGDALVQTHREAHGLLPDEIHQVKQGQ